ncbi:MAG: FtsQ-type POTRA domain-containing protein [Spirochaetaceae bacterium]|nr:FtsQ-type POTRA domain-containing protein [Spirochaetaceae bacterium]
MRLEKSLIKLFIVCSLLLLGELLWLFVIGPCMPLASVEISGIESLSRITVLDRAGINARTSYFSLNVRKAAESLKTIPQVERVDISKKFPDSVIIRLYARTPAALALASLGGRIVPVIFDKEGVIFQIGNEDELASRGNLPIISGIIFDNVRTGLRLPEFIIPLLADIQKLSENSPEVLAALSELQINKKNNDSFDLTLYPAQTKVRIRIGSELSAEKISYALLLLDVLKERRINVDEIDFRSETASYKLRDEV